VNFGLKAITEFVTCANLDQSRLQSFQQTTSRPCETRACQLFGYFHPTKFPVIHLIEPFPFFSRLGQRGDAPVLWLSAIGVANFAGRMMSKSGAGAKICQCRSQFFQQRNHRDSGFIPAILSLEIFFSNNRSNVIRTSVFSWTTIRQLAERNAAV